MTDAKEVRAKMLRNQSIRWAEVGPALLDRVEALEARAATLAKVAVELAFAAAPLVDGHAPYCHCRVCAALAALDIAKGDAR